ncbi:hypothetical protein BT69DRAFT_1339029 [Atractiella rhizophila]|nr:hypothetical protein BT69DRAFT_1339029 [Atractiella rhizophila]
MDISAQNKIAPDKKLATSIVVKLRSVCGTSHSIIAHSAWGTFAKLSQANSGCQSIAEFIMMWNNSYTALLAADSQYVDSERVRFLIFVNALEAEWRDVALDESKVPRNNLAVCFEHLKKVAHSRGVQHQLEDKISTGSTSCSRAQSVSAFVTGLDRRFPPMGRSRCMNSRQYNANIPITNALQLRDHRQLPIDVAAKSPYSVSLEDVSQPRSTASISHTSIYDAIIPDGAHRFLFRDVPGVDIVSLPSYVDSAATVSMSSSTELFEDLCPLHPPLFIVGAFGTRGFATHTGRVRPLLEDARAATSCRRTLGLAFMSRVSV